MPFDIRRWHTGVVASSRLSAPFRMHPAKQVVSWRSAVSDARRLSITSMVPCHGWSRLTDAIQLRWRCSSLSHVSRCHVLFAPLGSCDAWIVTGSSRRATVSEATQSDPSCFSLVCVLLVCVFCFISSPVSPVIPVHLNPSCNRLQTLIGKKNEYYSGGDNTPHNPSPLTIQKKKHKSLSVAAIYPAAASSFCRNREM